MTPKEKAEELMDNMLGYGDEYHHCTQYVAKQCALIAIRFAKNCISWHQYPLDAEWKELNEIQKEIEKL